MFEFAKEMFFDEKAIGNKSIRDKFFNKLLNSSAAMAGSLKDKSLSEEKTQNPKESSHMQDGCHFILVTFGRD